MSEPSTGSSDTFGCELPNWTAPRSHYWITITAPWHPMAMGLRRREMQNQLQLDCQTAGAVPNADGGTSTASVAPPHALHTASGPETAVSSGPPDACSGRTLRLHRGLTPEVPRSRWIKVLSLQLIVLSSSSSPHLRSPTPPPLRGLTVLEKPVKLQPLMMPERPQTTERAKNSVTPDMRSKSSENSSSHLKKTMELDATTLWRHASSSTRQSSRWTGSRPTKRPQQETTQTSKSCRWSTTATSSSTEKATPWSSTRRSGRTSQPDGSGRQEGENLA